MAVEYKFDCILWFFYKVKISTNYNEIILQFFVFSVALARMSTILPVIREIPPINKTYFKIKLGMSIKNWWFSDDFLKIIWLIFLKSQVILIVNYELLKMMIVD